MSYTITTYVYSGHRPAMAVVNGGSYYTATVRIKMW